MPLIVQLFRDYQTELDIDLCFQGFESEIEGLPGKYSAPQGGLLLALHDGIPAGCAAFRPLDGPCCELKRFYVDPQYRRHGLASQLLSQILNGARAAGYTEARLDTLDRLKAALAFYARHGFQEIPAYYENPMPDVIYMTLPLTAE